MRVRALAGAAVLLAFASAASGEEEEWRRPAGEFGVRYWLSTGSAKHSHNAQGFLPSAGNPTSTLTYTNLDANAIEIFGRQVFERSWFLKGNLGWGRVNTGWFQDEDFAAGQVKFSDTLSAVSKGWLGYGTIDLGYQWLLREGAIRLGAFAGYTQWTEYVEAHGATDRLGFIGGDIPTDITVISNKAIWRALRVGFAGDFAVSRRAWLSVDLAAIPYARIRNEDSHLLRTDPSDLGPAPNIIIEGNGYGLQADAEVRYAISRRTEVGLGVRYWYMRSTDGDRIVLDDFKLPLVEIYSERFGALLSLRRTW